MANSPQAIKRARQAGKRALQNTKIRSTLRTSIKKVIKLVEAGSKDAIQSAYKSAVVLIDRAAGNGMIHPNKAARLKSRLNKRIK